MIARRCQGIAEEGLKVVRVSKRGCRRVAVGVAGVAEPGGFAPGSGAGKACATRSLGRLTR